MATGELQVEGLLASLDGHVVLRHRSITDAADAGGREVARFLLEEAGGAELLVR